MPIDMTGLRGLERMFWPKVWQCTHRYPCKRCCWPWRAIDTTVNWKCIWQEHPLFKSKKHGIPTQLAASRIAYELRFGTIAFPTRAFHACHQCHFGPCCNPSHILIGSRQDNAHDQAPARRNPPSIVLPDGRVWLYRDACVSQSCYLQAIRFQRVWAGPIPARRYVPSLTFFL